MTLPKTPWPVRALWRAWYPVLTGLTRAVPLPFLNYGYGGADPAADIAALPLAEADEPDRPGIQLYHRVAGAVDLAGRRVLEVSCGHGGGASFIARYLGAAAVHAVDRNARAVARCRRRHAGVPGLTFARGDALALPAPDETFDAVVNVEASHCYADIGRFLAEARRVLRPGGHLLYADFRDRGRALDAVRGQVGGSGLAAVEEEDISPGVVRGMQANTARYTALVRRLVPRPLWGPALKFAGVAGSPVYEDLKTGATVYFRYVLRKPGPPA